MSPNRSGKTRAVKIAPGVTIGGGKPLVFFLGPCAIEGLQVSLRAAG